MSFFGFFIFFPILFSNIYISFDFSYVYIKQKKYLILIIILRWIIGLFIFEYIIELIIDYLFFKRKDNEALRKLGERLIRLKSYRTLFP